MASGQEKLEWFETTTFVRAVSRFAWANTSAFGDPQETLQRFFGGILIGPHSLKTAFIREGLTGPFLGPPIRFTRRALLSLHKCLRADLEALGKAAGVWRQPIPAEIGTLRGSRALRKFQMKNGRTVVLDLTGTKVIVPDEVRRRLSRSIPRQEVSPAGTFEPILRNGSIAQLLYYGLAIAVSRDVLLRCGLCATCGALVVHSHQPSTPLGRCFCEPEKGIRDCKSEFHNPRRSERATEAKARSRKKARAHRIRADREARLRHMLSLLIKEAASDHSHLMKRINWQKGRTLAKKCSQRLKDGVSPEEVWTALPEGVKKELEREAI